MRVKSCTDCYYFDICHGVEACDDFDYLSEDMITDEDIAEFLATHRAEYLKAWNTYIREFND